MSLHQPPTHVSPATRVAESVESSTALDVLVDGRLMTACLLPAVSLDGKSPVIEVPILGSYGPNVFVSALALRNA